MKNQLSKHDLNSRNDAICRDFSKGGVTKVALAKKYGVDERTIRRVLLNHSVDKPYTTTNISVQPSKKKKPLKVMVESHCTTSAQKSVEEGSKGSVINQPLSVKQQMEAGNAIAYILTPDSVILTVGDSTEIVDISHVNFEKIKTLIAQNKFKDAVVLMNISKAITEYSNGTIQVKNGKLFYGELEIHNNLVERILTLMDQGDDGFKPLINMLTKLLENPSNRSVNELWGFLKHTDIQITDDGYLLCWKLLTQKSDGSIVDTYTKKVPNELGYRVSMPRSMVNDNASQTCSQGLHVCSWGYLRSYIGNVIHQVLVHPKDVVSVPNDYADKKMRVSEYLNFRRVDGEKKIVDETPTSTCYHVVVGRAGEILSKTKI